MTDASMVLAELIKIASSAGSLPPPPLPPADKGDNGKGEMEARLARLESDMGHVKSEMAKLAGVPADLAVLKERSSHLPTKSEMHKEIEAQVDRSATRVQRTVGITGALVAIAVAAMNYLPGLIS